MTTLNRIGFVGWRGLVGSVLHQRMLAEQDFAHIEQPVFFSTSQAGEPGPKVPGAPSKLRDASDFEALAQMDAIVSCQGSDYTREAHTALREQGWEGYWIDAASLLRMEPDATIILDPVNSSSIKRALAAGKKDFIAGNCTVSLMILALHGLLQSNEVEWINAATYQAISGAGAKAMHELIEQMGVLERTAKASESNSITGIEQALRERMLAEDFPTEAIGQPLAGNLLPWIDADLEYGESREEAKGEAETNKILGLEHAPIRVISTCVRIGSLRCHSQALTLKLKRSLPRAEINRMLGAANSWVKLVDNTREASLAELTPARAGGQLDIMVGRVRTHMLEDEPYLSLFTVADQLLWGAAENLRRMLHILRSS